MTLTAALLATTLLPFGLFNFLPSFFSKPTPPPPPPKPKIVLTTASEPMYDITFEVISTPTITPTNLPTPSPTVITTPTLTHSPVISSITPTKKPTSSPTPKPTSAPTSAPPPQVVPTSSVVDYMMGEINNYRRSQGLSEVRTDPYTCGFAQTRASEASSAFNHDGFTNRLNSKTLPYPSYSVVTENLARNSDYKKVVPAWINSSGHAANMRKDTPYVCVAQNGNFYAYEGFKP